MTLGLDTWLDIVQGGERERVYRVRSSLLGRMTAALGCFDFVHAMRGFVHVTAKAVFYFSI